MTDSDVKYFVSGFLRFLNQQIEQRGFTSDVAESLEVAIQCLETAYEIPPQNLPSTDSTTEAASSSGTSDCNPLNNIDLFELFRSACLDVNPARKQEADNLKNEGNHLMKEEKYQEALIMYNRAISIDATNPVFYCNRAAAFNRIGEYQKAVDDCLMALRYDPNYSKAFGRLGLAFSKMNKHEKALEAYRNAIRIEPDNLDYHNNMTVTQQRLEELSSGVGGNAAPGGFPLNMGLFRDLLSNAGTDPNNPNITGGDFSAALNNQSLISFLSRMIADPSIQDMLSSLSGINNIDAVWESGRNFAQQMSDMNPALFATLNRQMEEHANRRQQSGTEENTDNTQREQPPPPPPNPE